VFLILVLNKISHPNHRVLLLPDRPEGNEGEDVERVWAVLNYFVSMLFDVSSQWSIVNGH